MSDWRKETDAARQATEQTAGEHDTRGSLQQTWRCGACCNDIKANLEIEKRSRVHPPVLGYQRALLSVRMELWEAVVYTHVFNGNIASKPRCCHCCAAVCDFILKMVLRHWRGRKATSNIWKELLLFISFFYEILLQNAWGDVGSLKKLQKSSSILKQLS